MPTHPAVALAAVLVLTTACSWRPHEQIGAFSWTAPLPPGTVLHILDGAGDIKVTSANEADAAGLRVRADKHWRRGHENDVDVRTVRNGNDVYVCAMWRASGNCGSRGYNGRKTDSFLSMFSLFHRSSDMSVDFEVSVPAGVVVDARTVTGEVTVDGLRSGVTARSVNGDVTGSDLEGRIVLTTTNGDVKLSTRSLASSDSIRLTTTNGDVEAEFPPDLNAVLDLSTTNGGVETQFPLTITGKRDNRIQTTLGRAERVIRMHTVNGDVALNKR